jgi:hypothetical protein
MTTIKRGLKRRRKPWTKKVPAMSVEPRYALNAICPYFTMFPLEYPMRVLSPTRLRRFRRPIVYDPYCGRGTTIFAARLRGLRAFGSDIEPVAVAIAQAKLADTTSEQVLSLYDGLVSDDRSYEVPEGLFWQWAYSEDVLNTISKVRVRLWACRTNAASILRAVMLGGLHGPRAKTLEGASYFSNQMPRTFASKPEYSVNYWKDRRLRAPNVDVRAIVKKRVERVLQSQLPLAKTTPVDIRCSDSRTAAAFERLHGKITHVVTSPPYYGLRTYAQDQWLRGWFLGRNPMVDYKSDPGLDHGSPELFAKSLAKVWNQIGQRAADHMEMYVRFGAISSRHASPDEILRESLTHSGHEWFIQTRHNARSATEGKRQAIQMSATVGSIEESDYSIRLR